jgi:hypothetical protein
VGWGGGIKRKVFKYSLFRAHQADKKLKSKKCIKKAAREASSQPYKTHTHTQWRKLLSEVLSASDRAKVMVASLISLKKFQRVNY